MNVTLNDVKLTDPNGNQYSCDNFFLKSRLIRYIHLSERVSLRMMLFNNSFKKQVFFSGRYISGYEKCSEKNISSKS